MSRTPLASRVAPAPRRSLRLHGAIARELGIAILAGRFRPGDILDGEVSSSERLAVSRTAYREAVRILAAKGLVEARPKVGTRVSAASRWHLLDPDILVWIFDSAPSPRLLESLFELRRVVESAAAGLAASRRTTGQLRAMRAALETMAASTLESEAGRRADMEFHATLLEATANPFMISLSSGVSAAIDATTMLKQRTGPLRDPMADHLRVYDAVAGRDAPGAERAMRELIALARRDARQARRKGRRNTKGGAAPDP
jgi:DNA-binding FadR family transcriptional regulator